MSKALRVVVISVVLVGGGVAVSSSASAQTASIWSPDGGARLTVSAVRNQLAVARVEDVKCDGRGPTGWVKVGNSVWYPVAVSDGCNREKTQTLSTYANAGEKVQYYICNANAKTKSCSSTASFKVP